MKYFVRCERLSGTKHHSVPTYLIRIHSETPHQWTSDINDPDLARYSYLVAKYLVWIWGTSQVAPNSFVYSIVPETQREIERVMES